MNTRLYWRSPLSWACNSGMLVFGVSFALLGALLPVLLEQLHLAVESAGALFVALNGGGLAVTVAGAWMLDRRGYRGYLVATALLAAAGLWTLSVAGGFAVLLLGCFLLGVGGGGLNLGTNALTSRLYPARPAAALNRLGLFFGAGTLLAPLVLRLWLESAGLVRLLQAGALVALLPALAFLRLQPPFAAAAPPLTLKQTAARLARPRLLLVCLALFFQSGNEMTIGGWLAAYLAATFQLQTQGAVLLLTLFWTALVAGRLAASRVLLSMSPSRLVLISSVPAWLLLVGLWNAQLSLPLTALLAIAVGLCMAPLFPTLLGQASSAAPDLSATALALALVPTTVGAMLFPWLAGQLAGIYGVQAVWWIPLTCFPLVAALQALASRSR